MFPPTKHRGWAQLRPRCCSFFAASLKRKTARKQNGIYICRDSKSFSFFLHVVLANNQSKICWSLLPWLPWLEKSLVFLLGSEVKFMQVYFEKTKKNVCLQPVTKSLFLAPFSSVKRGASADSTSRARSPSSSILAFTPVERGTCVLAASIQNVLLPKKRLQVTDGFLALAPRFLHKSPAIGATLNSTQATAKPSASHQSWIVYWGWLMHTFKYSNMFCFVLFRNGTTL